mgnify:CR=1 FL=1
MRYEKISSLQAGITIARPLLDEKGNILLREGNVLSPTVFKRVVNMGVQGLYIQDEISEDVFVEDLIDYSLKLKSIKCLMNHDISGAITCAKQIVDELKRKDSLQVNLIDIKNNENYTYKHSVAVCVYSIIIGLSLGLTETQLDDLAVAAMLHDIGKFKLPMELLHKTTKLTASEYEMMQKHPRLAYEELQQYHEVTSVVRNTVLYHHENVDGTGYYGVSADKLTVYAKIIHIADVFDALTSIRKYRDAFSPQEAIEYIMGNAGKQFDMDIVNVFTQKFPIYPIGLTVRLSNGEKAVVVTNEHNSLRPIIRLFNEKLNNPLIDLSDNKNYFNVTIQGLD